MEKPRIPRYVVELARKMRSRPTGAEDILWTCLRNRKIVGAKFRRQHPLGRYIADFYCHEARIAIEVEGSMHEVASQEDIDAVRIETIEQHGIRVLRVTNEEVFGDLQGVLEAVINALNTPLPAGEGPGVRAYPTPTKGSGERIPRR